MALAIQEHSRGYAAEPLVLGPDDALPFLSSNAAALADAGLGLSRLSRAARSSLAVAALSFSALEGNLEAFSRAVERVTPMLGAPRHVPGHARADRVARRAGRCASRTRTGCARCRRPTACCWTRSRRCATPSTPT